ncbi:MAG: HigA family addiction module antidote protein [Rhodospirillum sp.]|nr:HigA family addiction module antidote protein [Rhodospirillum sp.]MCF8488473.1 HigA family addiction module antidote protein [Rhodospirillum sp.]MCF8502377.1 HigA family addiction module antidote protein [Rhodospirillum sp.]
MAASGDRHQHPGRVLQRMFMEPNRLGVNQLARALKVPPNRISAILNGQRSITADTALRFARFFDTTALYWMNLQARYDLGISEQVLREEIESAITTLKDHKASPLDDSPVEDDAES